MINCTELLFSNRKSLRYWQLNRTDFILRGQKLKPRFISLSAHCVGCSRIKEGISILFCLESSSWEINIPGG